MRGIFSTSARAIGALGLTLAAGGGTAMSQPDKPMVALGQLEPGLWEMRGLDNVRTKRRPICLGDPAVLIQLEHGQITCSRLVIANKAQMLTVHYVCPFNGFGQTSVRVQSPRLARIETQGIVNNAPFAYRVELRRLGPCDIQGRARR